MPVDDPDDDLETLRWLKDMVDRLLLAADRQDGEHPGSGVGSLQIGSTADAAGDRSTALGPGAWAHGDDSTAVGHTSYAGAEFSAAFGHDAFVDPSHTRSFAIGSDAVTLAADEGAIGANYHTVGIAGKFRLASHPPATLTSAGTQGEVAWDTDYWYVCTTANTWKRIGIFGTGGGGSGSTPAADYTKTTASLANNANEAGTFTLGGSEVHEALVVTADRAARVRFYATTGQRDADVSRPIGTDPTGNHGLLLETVLTVGDLTYTVTPSARLFEQSAFGAVPVSITNTSGSTSTVLVTVKAKGI